MPAEATQDLLSMLRALVAGGIDASASDALIKRTIHRTEQAIYWLSMRKNYRLHALGLTLRDLSYDISAELLAEGEDSCCAALRAALLPMAEASDAELLSQFEAVIFYNVQRHFPRIFSEINPLQHTLLKAVRKHVQGRDDIEIRDMLDGRWYLAEPLEQADLYKPAAPVEIIRQSLVEFNPRNRSEAVEVFRSILRYLRGQDEYRKAVLEMDVIRITVDYLGRDLEAAIQLDQTDASISYDVSVLSHIIHLAIDAVRPSLENLYIKRGRLSLWEFELMLLAIKATFLDLQRGDDVRSGYSFLRLYMPGLSPERFRETYRRKFAYMYERVVQEAKRHLMADSNR
ncbi:MAG: hypothetical protein IH600_04105 [Bacteroidetes bacterium]|nr:hypothetical protein [Bacteroidota bacterium]